MLGNVELFYRANSTSWRDTNGAQERTRTSTPLRAPAPEAGASTNSATWARELRKMGGRPRRLKVVRKPCQRPSHSATLDCPADTQTGLLAGTEAARKSLRA